MSLKKLLKHAISVGVTAWQQKEKHLFDLSVTIEVENTRDPNHGDFATNVAMLLAKPANMEPIKLAHQIVAHLPELPWVKHVTVAKPGFINFTLTDELFQSVIPEILIQGSHYGHLTLGNEEPLHIEIVSANPTGPLHVGHGRIAAYSASLANILEAVGFKVHREYYVNDAGRQMRILAISVWLRYLELWGEHLSFPRRGYRGDYVIEIAQALKTEHDRAFWLPTDELWANLPEDNETNQEIYVDALITRAENLLGTTAFNTLFDAGLNRILNDIREDLQEFGVTCQRWFMESELTQTGEVVRGLDILKAGGHLYQAEGATWFRTTDFGDEKDRVVIRENGQPTYFASDVGYHLDKITRGFRHLLDVYGADHHGYIPRLRALIQALGEDVQQLHVLLVQFAILYRGKTRVSMSTRGGEFVTLRELREEVGNDAARFFYVMRRREQHLDFDLELAKSQSSDNPVYYIQYAHARVCSVFRQLEQKNWFWDQKNGEQSLSLLDNLWEKSLLRCLARYSDTLATAAVTYEPSVVAHFLQELAQNFHAYYNACLFLVEDVPLRDARLCLIAAVRQVLANGLCLLGVSTPEMM